MKVRARWLFVVGVVVCVALVAGVWLTRPQPVLVQAQKLDHGSVEMTVSNTRAGEVQACQRTKLSTILGGRIEFLGVKEGDRVKKGQRLMQLWNEDQLAEISVAQAQAQSATQRIAEVCTAAANAQREAERTKALRSQGFVSIAREDQTQSEARARQAACESMRADLVTAQTRVKAAQTGQRRTVIIAPFDGTIAKISGELGEYATPSPPGVPTPPVIDLIDDSCLYVKAPMDEVDAPRIRVGQPVRVKLDAVPNKVFEGKVRRVAPYINAVEKQARTVDIEVDFLEPKSQEGLLVGLSTDVEVILARKEDALRVPTSAVRESNQVMVIGPDQKLMMKTFKPGLSNWQFTEVLEGLDPEEMFITSLEREGVKPGALVKVE